MNNQKCVCGILTKLIDSFEAIHNQILRITCARLLPAFSIHLVTSIACQNILCQRVVMRLCLVCHRQPVVEFLAPFFL